MTTHAIFTLNSTTPVNLTPGLTSGWDITIQNLGSIGYVYLGSNNVSTTNYGYRIKPGEAFSLEIPGKDKIYAVSEESTAQVAVLKFALEVGR
jgi:hypothetical protein